MKRITLQTAVLLLAIWTTQPVLAQTDIKMPRTIQVTGTAEKEITPDEIYVSVTLQEYTKKNGNKVAINDIRDHFLKACKEIGLADSAIVVQGFSGYNNNYWYYKKRKQNPDMKATLNYEIMFKNTAMMDALVDKMDDAATQNFYISRTDYSQLDALKEALKIAAIKAAKEKALALTSAIGEKLGHAITISDPDETNYYTPQPYYKSMGAMESANADAGEPVMNVDFKKMKLEYKVRVLFSLD